MEPKRFNLTLDTVNKAELEPVVPAPKKKVEAPAAAEKPDADAEDEENAKPTVDAVRDETLQIIGDMIRLGQDGKVAGAEKPKAPGKLGIFGF